MKIKIENSLNLPIDSVHDLEKILPTRIASKVLNFGQGEGQFQIGEFIWGIYIDTGSGYYLKFEEGSCDLGYINSVLDEISDKISLQINQKPKFSIIGDCDHYLPHEKFLNSKMDANRFEILGKNAKIKKGNIFSRIIQILKK